MEELSKISTQNLVKELEHREGVKKIIANPYDKYAIDVEGINHADRGPAIIFVVTD